MPLSNISNSKNLSVTTAVYEGPLELLLELIEKRKLLINDISLAAVTDEYIARVSSATELPVGETAEFVALAATLLLIKSRSLLPQLELSPDESRDIKELEYRLALYQIIKEAARGLTGQLGAPALYGGNPPAHEAFFLPDDSVTLANLRDAAHTLIQGFPQSLTLPKVAVKKIISIEEMIERLQERVSSALRLSFKEFAGVGKKERTEIIASFLAMLELVKQGILNASQDAHFGDIMLESDTVSTPSYE
jgi:segregation and condensation protein A